MERNHTLALIKCNNNILSGLFLADDLTMEMTPRRVSDINESVQKDSHGASLIVRDEQQSVIRKNLTIARRKCSVRFIHSHY